MQAQAADFDLGRVARGIRLKFGRCHRLACDDCVSPCREFGGYSLALQGERSGLGWPFGKDDGIFRIGAETVLTRLEPEQASQGQPFLLEILNQFAFPLVERLLVGRVGPDWSRLSAAGAIAHNTESAATAKITLTFAIHTFRYSLTSGRGSRPRPSKICANSLTSGPCRWPFEAKVSRLFN